MKINVQEGSNVQKVTETKMLLSEKEIRKYTRNPDLCFEIYETVSSTNTLAKLKAQNGASEGTVIISSSQTEGRGRLGRRFFSPFDSGIYMSVILRPQIDISEAILITTCAAVAVSEAIEKVTDKKTQIKWVNDIYIDNKKVCGILSEAALNSKTMRADYVTLGIGINVVEPQNGFPDEIKNIATSLYKKENYQSVENRLVAEILNIFFDYYVCLNKKVFYKEYKKRMFLNGREVTVVSNFEYKAKVLDVAEDFSLVVEKQNGEILHLNSGEVSTRLN